MPVSDSVDGPSMSESSFPPANPPSGGFKIRIPNPTLYMERQSKWKNQRGKPRCDSCRGKKLKCDRERPACNFCKLSKGDKTCSYTPLPTPAHRGIPRCDRCRELNIGCDRTVPTCEQCASVHTSEQLKCNYTAKRRTGNSVPKFGSITDTISHGSQTSVRSTSPVQIGPATSTHIETTAIKGESYLPLLNCEGEEVSYAVAKEREQVVGPTKVFELMDTEPKFIIEKIPKRALPLKNAQPKTRRPRNSHGDGQLTFITHAFRRNPETVATFIIPWKHPAFANIPAEMLRTVEITSLQEMPGRQSYDDLLSDLLHRMTDEARMTAAIPPDTYALMAESLRRGDLSQLPSKIKEWTEIHHIRSGPSRPHSLFVPKEDLTWYSRTSGHGDPHSRNNVHHDLMVPDIDSTAMANVYDIVPVRPQIFDILVYGHRMHGSSTELIGIVRKTGVANITWTMAEIFVRKCPTCNGRRSSPALALDVNLK